jgi:flagellar hook-associated protein 2
MKTYQAQLYAQYSALDTLMSSMKNTSSFLTQQFNAINGTSSSSSSS